MPLSREAVEVCYGDVVRLTNKTLWVCMTSIEDIRVRPNEILGIQLFRRSARVATQKDKLYLMVMGDSYIVDVMHTGAFSLNSVQSVIMGLTSKEIDIVKLNYMKSLKLPIKMTPTQLQLHTLQALASLLEEYKSDVPERVIHEYSAGAIRLVREYVDQSGKVVGREIWERSDANDQNRRASDEWEAKALDANIKALIDEFDLRHPNIYHMIAKEGSMELLEKYLKIKRKDIVDTPIPNPMVSAIVTPTSPPYDVSLQDVQGGVEELAKDSALERAVDSVEGSSIKAESEVDEMPKTKQSVEVASSEVDIEEEDSYLVDKPRHEDEDVEPSAAELRAIEAASRAKPTPHRREPAQPPVFVRPERKERGAVTQDMDAAVSKAEEEAKMEDLLEKAREAEVTVENVSEPPKRVPKLVEDNRTKESMGIPEELPEVSSDMADWVNIVSSIPAPDAIAGWLTNVEIPTLYYAYFDALSLKPAKFGYKWLAQPGQGAQKAKAVIKFVQKTEYKRSGDVTFFKIRANIKKAYELVYGKVGKDEK